MDIANKSLCQSSCCHIKPVVFQNFFVFWVIGCCLEMNLLLFCHLGILNYRFVFWFAGVQTLPASSRMRLMMR
jgi:hypothetical protein